MSSVLALSLLSWPTAVSVAGFSVQVQAWGPALANHLWQSTAMFVAVWLLVLLLRRNRAAMRHALWCAASLKFLLPFALLARLVQMVHAPLSSAPVGGLATVVRGAAQPFVPAQASAWFPQAAAAPGHDAAARTALVFASLWAAGAVVVLTVWCRHWIVARSIACSATRVRSGRVYELLAAAQQRAFARRAVPLLVCTEHGEPGLFGIVRPVLFWPASLAEQLSDEQIETILLHELVHARRRDNLVAALHMLVQVLFWFHPAVWLLESRLLAERELACDEAVIALGSDRRTYAQSLIEASRHAVGGSLPNVAGFASQGVLSSRVAAVLRASVPALGNLQKSALLLVAALALAVSVVLGQAAAPLEFEAASVRQSPLNSPARGGKALAEFETEGAEFHGGLISANVPLDMYLDFAYKVTDARQALAFSNQMPAWAHGVNYDIQARAAQGATGDEVRRMMQSLLADRFALHLHSDTRVEPALVLTLSGDAPGPQLHVHPAPTPCVHRAPANSPTPESTAGARPVYCGLDEWNHEGRLHFRYTNATASELAAALGAMHYMTQSDPSSAVAYSVVDQTGMHELVDLDVEFVKNEQQAEANHAVGPTFDEALKHQLGMKLSKANVPVTTMVIDHLEPPKAN